ncbi:RNA-directed DNA polymerase, eukaryota, reverse transcriptase zinc-binding domain protein [Tanacetum coccineum]
MSTQKEVSDVSMRSDAEECIEGNQSNNQEDCNAMEKDKMNEGFKDNVVVEEVSEVQDKAELEDANGSGMDNVHCTFVNNTNKVINSNVSKVSNVETPVSYVGTLTKNVTADDNKLFNIPTSVNSKGEEVVLFDEDLVLEGCEKWKLTVCGYFVGCKMHINVLKYNIKRMWTRFGLKDIVVDADEMCFFKFKDEEGMKYVIDQSPWIMNGKPLIVQKWDPENVIEKKTPCKIPVWIRLYNVPLEAWSIKGRLGYARVLVKVNAGKEYLEKIEINYVDAIKKVGNEGFVEVKNRKKNNGNVARMNNGTQGNKQSYKVNMMNIQQRYVVKQKALEQKSKEGRIRVILTRGNQVLKAMEIKGWNIGSKNIMEMRKNANKYAVLSEEVDDEELGDNVCQDDRLIVDRYILMKSKPPPEEMMKWTYDMKLYFKYRWDAVNRENENSDEEDIIEEVNAIKDFVADEIGGGDSQLLN